MKKTIIKRWLIILLVAILCSSMLCVGVGCDDDDPYAKYTFDHSNFFGLCEVSGDISASVDKALTNEFVSDMAGALGVKSFRIWTGLSDMMSLDENDEIVPNYSKLSVYRDFVSKLKAAGVENLVLLVSSFVQLKDYPTTTGLSLPDPNEEYDVYIRFLKAQEKAVAYMAREFPDIHYFEMTNEPDGSSGASLNKNGYTLGGSTQINVEYMFTKNEVVHIISDLCWYGNRGIKSVNSANKMLSPAFTFFDDTPDYLDAMYTAIESKTLPAGEEYSDTNVDNYFQILDWHPYSMNGSREIDDEWLALQKAMYDVAIKHNDGGKPVWCTEIGWTDFGIEDDQQGIADRFVKMLEVTRAELPFVEVVFIFRLSTLATQDISLGENNFGIMYNPEDPVYPGKPRPAMIAIAKYFKGEDADLSALYKYDKTSNS